MEIPFFHPHPIFFLERAIQLIRVFAFRFREPAPYYKGHCDRAAWVSCLCVCV